MMPVKAEHAKEVTKPVKTLNTTQKRSPQTVQLDAQRKTVGGATQEKGKKKNTKITDTIRRAKITNKKTNKKLKKTRKVTLNMKTNADHTSQQIHVGKNKTAGDKKKHQYIEGPSNKKIPLKKRGT